MKLRLDFETFSECDIKASGAWKYAEHPTTRPLCLAWAIDDQAPRLWTPDQGEPRQLFDLVERGAELHAWNSFFEYVIWHLCCKWPIARIQQWHDTAARAAMAAMPRSLDACGNALGLPTDQRKSKRGKYLIQRLCQPFRGKVNADPALLAELYEYCRQDVVAERAVDARLPPMPARERTLWTLDQAINIRGIGVDQDRVVDAIVIANQVEQQYNDELFQITGGELADTNARVRALDFLASRGVSMASFDKATVAETLATVADPIARRVLEIRQALGKTSVAKYWTLRDITARDGRAHGLLRYHGAATGRWSGALFQPQNLPRPTIGDRDNPAPTVNAAIETLSSRDPEWLAALFGCPMETLSSCVRGMLVPKPGHRFVAADFSAIEPRVLRWLAGDEEILQLFRDGRELYPHAAAKLYKIDVADVTKSQRFVGKVSELSLGYQGGANALCGMARNYGVELDPVEADAIKSAWREANPNVVRLWHSMEKSAIVCVRSSREQPVRGFPRDLKFEVVRDWLTMRLPSGRRLWYFDPALLESDGQRAQVEFSGVDTFTRQWTRTTTYGGKLVENAVQAIARDVMADAMVRVERAGYRIVLTVHDEIVCEVPDDFGSVDEFVRLLCTVPDWADGLPLAAVGESTLRYGK